MDRRQGALRQQYIQQTAMRELTNTHERTAKKPSFPDTLLQTLYDHLS